MNIQNMMNIFKFNIANGNNNIMNNDLNVVQIVQIS